MMAAVELDDLAAVVAAKLGRRGVHLLLTKKVLYTAKDK